jgi:hypothetical protein
MPAKAGIQRAYNYLKRLDSRFHRNDKKALFQTFYESIKFGLSHLQKDGRGQLASPRSGTAMYCGIF